LNIMKYVLRYPRGLLRRILGLFSNLFWALRWNLGTAKSANSIEAVGHLLIVKNADYVRVARICISSFLYFNPNAIIHIHCDQVTYKKSQAMVRFLSRKNQIRVDLDQSDQHEWQYSKLKLILNLSGSYDFYMDADLKWNGSLPILESTTFFVREFILMSKIEYKELLEVMNLQELTSNTMKNTSFFSWNGCIASEKFRSKLFGFWSSMLETIDEMAVSDLTKNSLRRISEQLCLSVLIPENESRYLKDADAQFDGTFVESSYFGATGTRFGWFGVTHK
jgi:hypothetical protein